MIYLLVVVLLLLLAMAYICLNRDLFSPTMITLFVFLFGAVVAAYGLLSWNYVEFTGIVIVVLALSLLSMLFGEIASKKSKSNILSISSEKSVSQTKPLSNRICFVNNIICVIALYLYYKRVLSIAIEYGYQGDNFLQYVRIGLSNGAHNGFVVFCLITWSKICAYFSIYFLIKSYFFVGLRKTILNRWQYLICIAVELIICYLSSSRFNFIKIASFVLFCYFLLYKEILKKKIKIGRITIVVLFSAFIVVMAFVKMGESRASFSGNNAIDKLIVYMGSSLPLFDYGIIHKELNSCELFAGRSLNGVWGILKSLNLTQLDSLKFLDLVQLNNAFQSNVYTMQYNLLKDFGILGLIIIEFFIGLFYGRAYRSCLAKKTDRKNILYCYFGFYLIIQLWDPSLFQEVFLYSWILELFLIYFLSGIIKKRCCEEDRKYERNNISRWSGGKVVSAHDGNK